MVRGRRAPRCRAVRRARSIGNFARLQQLPASRTAPAPPGRHADTTRSRPKMKIARGLTIALAAAVFAGAALAQKTQLTVYTALEQDQLKPYAEGFNKANPDIAITWVQDSTGIITAKIMAEKANPRADVIWGLAATSMAVFDQEGMLLPYAPAGLARVAPQYRDPKNPPTWVGMDVWGATI